MIKLTAVNDVTSKPVGVVLHAKAGTGKTTFLVDAINDSPKGILFQCGEDSLGDLRVAVPHYPDVIGSGSTYEEYITGWTQFLDILTALVVEKHDFKTVAFDNIDNIINNNLDAFVVNRYYQNDVGKANAWGGDKLKEMYSEFSRVIKAFEMLQHKGIGVYVSSHSQTIKAKDPRLDEYKRWSFNIPAREDYNIRNLLLNWSSACLFGTIDIKVDKSGKASGDNHVLMTKQDAAYDAKNRYSLPDKIDFRYSVFKDEVTKSFTGGK
jgi:hypothetical protein